MKTRSWLLKHYVDGTRLPEASDFELVERELAPLQHGQVLVRSIYLSMDPYMRGRISPARNYKDGVSPGQVMTGRVVGQVLESRHAGYMAGDVVMGELGWTETGVADGQDLRKVDPALAPISTALGLLGMPGLTAYFALLDLGEPRPGDTVLVTAASGAVGSAVGQIARLCGCRTIALAGSDAKVAYCREELGYDAAINYRTEPDLSAAVGRAAPRGVNVFFDNSGGTVHQAVLPHLAIHARIALCGVMSQYNPTDVSKQAMYNMRHLLVARATLRGFLIYDFAHRQQEGLERLARWYRDGQLKYREAIAEGIERAPAALRTMLVGDNFGKQLVRLAPDPFAA